MSPLGNALGGISSTLQPATPSVPKATANPRGRPSSAQRSSADSSLNPSNSPVNHTERVRSTLDKLTGLECRLDHVSEALDAICKATIEDPECLSPLYTQAEEISRQLQSISIKAHAVVVYHQVEAKLEAVVAKLDTLQGEMATKPPTPPDSQSYDTSHHFANRLNSADPHSKSSSLSWSPSQSSSDSLIEQGVSCFKPSATPSSLPSHSNRTSTTG
ncbi:hypothetical protein BKA70DRAFT_1417585 [Coprinopsis sp. MPI-PUGE-AT-0042]|nr:hypothetical protein BKA70DRAFT_1417585 [Coprinopsis sp. MPI-PUGE-AT-0042]